MKKGDIILAKAFVFTKEFHYGQREIVYTPKTTKRNGDEIGGTLRPLCRIAFDKPKRGLVVGRTVRISGVYTIGHSWNYEERNPGDLWNPVYHKVILVEPIDSERWTAPIACLEEDLSLESER